MGRRLLRLRKRPFKLKEEYYHNIRFRQNDARLVPILTTPIPGEAAPQVVAWAVQRGDGGRGFATTCGHSHANLQLNAFRRMHLNAIVWTAGNKVPPGGVESPLPAHKEPQQASSAEPVKGLIITGCDHPAHKWGETTPTLLEALWEDERFLVDVTHDPEMMASTDLSPYDVLLLHYCNWKRPGLSDAAKQGFLKYLSGGGGLSIIHFANGAFHHSLPQADQSDWPEYRKICRRVWDHSGGSGHDPFGRFRVQIVNAQHPITKGMISFDTVDELYYRQKGVKQPGRMSMATSDVAETLAQIEVTCGVSLLLLHNITPGTASKAGRPKTPTARARRKDREQTPDTASNQS